MTKILNFFAGTILTIDGRILPHQEIDLAVGLDPHAVYVMSDRVWHAIAESPKVTMPPNFFIGRLKSSTILVDWYRPAIARSEMLDLANNYHGQE